MYSSSFLLFVFAVVLLCPSANGQNYCPTPTTAKPNEGMVPETLEIFEYFDDSEDVEGNEEATYLATCAFDGLPQDTSQERPYVIGYIPDDIAEGQQIWRHPFVGWVNYTSLGTGSGNTSQHRNSLTASWLNGAYTMTTNQLTKQFTRTFQTRNMYRHVVLVCCPDAGRVRYHFIIPLQDMTPPKFQQDEYSFHITADWNRNRPISEGQFVIVGDNAYEIQGNDNFLQYSSSDENFLRVEAHRLWVQPNPDIFQYRLDLYLGDSVVLSPGQNVQLILSAKDQFNTGSAIINIYVES